MGYGLRGSGSGGLGVLTERCWGLELFDGLVVFCFVKRGSWRQTFPC